MTASAGMPLADLAATSAAVTATPGRSAKVELLAQCLRRAPVGEVALAVSYLSGDLPQRRTGIGWATLRELPPPAPSGMQPSLWLADVDRAVARMAALGGPGSAAERARQVRALFALATPDEQRLLRGVLSGELRQGAQAGLLADAVARAAGVPLAAVRRAAMLRGSLPVVAQAAMVGGEPALAAFHLEVGRPVSPMLAATAPSVAAALDQLGTAAVEWKLDGVRVQIHKDGSDVALFTRTLDDVTARLPEVVAAARGLPVRTAVLDTEVLAVRPDGRPDRFQHTASRTARRAGAAPPTGRQAADPAHPVVVPAGAPDRRPSAEAAALRTYVFDVLHVDGAELLDLPAADRAEAASLVLPAGLRVPRVVPTELAAARAFAADALARGHEGVMVKALSAPYEAGRRGASWLKVKPRHTLDLVVLAVEWGSGRRRGWLSNLHLGARDPDGGFVMLGKTFKGLTDELLRWQTERLLELETARNDWQVFVRPELVVEVAFDGVQTSSRYPGGVALRFARVIRYRPDKPASEADTLDTVLAIHDGRRPPS